MSTTFFSIELLSLIVASFISISISASIIFLLFSFFEGEKSFSNFFLNKLSFTMVFFSSLKSLEFGSDYFN